MPTVTKPKTAAKVRDCWYDIRAREFVAIFRDGKMYRVRRSWLADDDGTEITRVRVEPDGSAFGVQQASGKRLEVPWDFILYHADPEYRYFKGRGDQQDLERGVALRIGQRVRELRRRKGVTTYELAARSGIARPNISRIEKGKHAPGVETLERLARALDVPLAELLSS